MEINEIRDTAKQIQLRNADLTFKFILIGDSNVGKTCFLYRFLQNEFNEESTPTIGLEHGSRVIHLRNSRVNISVWDTAGTETFRSMSKQYYRSSSAVFLVFDLTNNESFLNCNAWLDEYLDNCSSESPTIILIGNKSDRTSMRRVKKENIEKFVEIYGLIYFETSAKDGKNVDQAFIDCAEIVYRKCEESKIDVNSRESGAFFTRDLLNSNFDTVRLGDERNKPKYCYCF